MTFAGRLRFVNYWGLFVWPDLQFLATPTVPLGVSDCNIFSVEKGYYGWIVKVDNFSEEIYPEIKDFGD